MPLQYPRHSSARCAVTRRLPEWTCLTAPRSAQGRQPAHVRVSTVSGLGWEALGKTQERLQSSHTSVPFDRSGRHSSPDFTLVERTGGDELKRLAWSGAVAGAPAQEPHVWVRVHPQALCGHLRRRRGVSPCPRGAHSRSRSRALVSVVRLLLGFSLVVFCRTTGAAQEIDQSVQCLAQHVNAARPHGRSGSAAALLALPAVAPRSGRRRARDQADKARAHAPLHV